MAAMRAGVKTVIIPSENEPDLDEIDKTVRRALKFVTTEHIDDILRIALDFDNIHEDEKPRVIKRDKDEAKDMPLGQSPLKTPEGATIRQ
jgi:ATP-dependent Lon protease